MLIARFLGHLLLVFCILFPYPLDPGLTNPWTLLPASLHLMVVPTFSPLLTASRKWFTCLSYLPLERLLRPCSIMWSSFMVFLKVSQFWTAFCSLIGAQVNLSSGYHPQYNGQTERLNQELETGLRILAVQSPKSWSKQLMWIEYTHNSLPYALSCQVYVCVPCSCFILVVTSYHRLIVIILILFTCASLSSPLLVYLYPSLCLVCCVFVLSFSHSFKQLFQV